MLLIGSLAMVLAVATAKQGEWRRRRMWLVHAALLGATFVGGRVQPHVLQEYRFTTNLFGLQLLHAHRLPRRTCPSASSC